MNIRRLRDPLVAALGALLIGGVSIALANSPVATASGAPATELEEPGGAPDTDALEEGDENGADDENQDPSYAGTATIAVDEASMPDDEAAEAEALAELATVSQADAEAAALAAVSGEIVETELENENGFLVWGVEVRDASGTVHEVTIDAGNAAVLGTQADDDGSEGANED